MIPDTPQPFPFPKPQVTRRWLAACGVRNVDRGLANIEMLKTLGWPESEIARFIGVLARTLPKVADPDQALNNLDRLLTASPEVSQKIRTLSSVGTPFEGLVTLLADSQYLADLLRDESNLDEIIRARFRPVARSLLVQSAIECVKSAKDFSDVMRRIRIFKQREILRIAWCDLVLGHLVEQVTEQISSLAAAVCEAAIYWCRNRLKKKFCEPFTSAPSPCRFVILALGKLGGSELNYSSDIDLIAVYEFDGKTSNSVFPSNQEYFSQLTRDFIRVVGEPTELGGAFRVDMRLRPSGSRGPICRSLNSTLQYYDLQGRTWERQAMIKARPIAGDHSLGNQILERLQPWIFRPNLTSTDIDGIRLLKRQIERRARVEGNERTDIKAGYGGIRDIEFAIQFMQMLNGSNQASLRTPNTLRAIGRLERAYCLTHEEAELLAGNYRWLRKLEHRLQLMHNQQTHSLPVDSAVRIALAKRMGISTTASRTLQKFHDRLDEVTRVNRVILDHLLHGAFGTAKVLTDDETTGSEEIDLILDPNPKEELIETVLSRWNFKDVKATWRILLELSEEKSQFISSLRCKHFFASIAHSLLAEISITPEPDRTLVSLSAVSDSLGSRGALWELFSASPATLNLYVRLCSSSDYLATILKTNPGMIDELLDALQRDSLPSDEQLRSNLEELTRGAVDLELILSSFKSSQHLRIGVRDILKQDDIAETLRALSDVAELCLQKVAVTQLNRQLQRHSISLPADEWDEVPFAILALGKLGGREPNYHSDLDVIFFHDSRPSFTKLLPSGVTPQFFFSELAAEIMKAVGKQTTQQRLYEIDSRLRPSGKSGALSVHVAEFDRYFESGTGQLWERQALCKARPVAGNVQLGENLMQQVHQILKRPCPATLQDDIWKMRLAMQHGAGERNLKRGAGGTVDIEFAVQMLQLQHASEHPEVLETGTIDTLETLSRLELLEPELADFFIDRYQFFRRVESGLRLMNTTARHDLPGDAKQLERLAFLLNERSGTSLAEEVGRTQQEIREKVSELFQKKRPVL